MARLNFARQAVRNAAVEHGSCSPESQKDRISERDDPRRVVDGRHLGAETEDDDPCYERVQERLVEDFDEEVDGYMLVPRFGRLRLEDAWCCCYFAHGSWLVHVD